MPRKPRVDGTKFARETAANLSRPLPEPPLALSERAAKYWPRVIGSKIVTAWTDTDLDTAWGLCEDLGKLEELRQTLQQEPAFVLDSRGGKRPHPAHKLIEETERRIQATKRHLQINSASTNGKSDHQRNKNATSRALGQTIANADDDLIAKPGF